MRFLAAVLFFLCIYLTGCSHLVMETPTNSTDETPGPQVYGDSTTQ